MMARRLLRPAGDRSAPDVVPVVGRRLPGPQRLPGRPARLRLHEQLRPLELAGVRRRDRRRRARRPTTPRGARFDRAEDDRPARRAGHPGELRHGLGAGPDGLLGAGQNGLGALRLAGLAWDDDDRVRRRAPGSCCSAPSLARCVARGGRAGRGPDVRQADDRARRSGRGSTFTQPVTLDGPPAGSRCC